MKRTEYTRLGEVVYRERLDNGLQICVIPKPGFARKYAFFAVNYGSIDTSFTLDGRKMRTPDGVAHYLEHKTFDMERGNALQLFAGQSASPNAFTSYSMTAYYFDCTERFEDNLRLLLEFVSTPCYTEESVEKERGIIEQEIRIYEDSADSRVYENLFACLYSDHPIRVPIAGTVESIREITAETLNDCHRAFYTLSNMMLCVVGDVEPETVRAIAGALFPGKPAVCERSCWPAEGTAPFRTRCETTMEIAMPTFAVGFKGTPAAPGPEIMRREFIGELAAEVLMGEASELYQRLYEQGLIDSGFSSSYEGLPGVAMLTAGGDSRDPDSVCRAILDEAARIGREGVDASLFARLKKAGLGSRLRDLDSFESVCYRQCSCFFDGCDYYSFPAVFESIGIEEVLEFLRQTVREDQMAVSVIRPKGETA